MKRQVRTAAVLAAVALIAALGATFFANADSSSPLVAGSFTPITLSPAVAGTARLHAKLPITVRVTAQPGVLNNHDGPLRLEVKLAPECGGTFQTTPGTVLLNQSLSPEPSSGLAYSTTLRANSGRPGQPGVQTLCEFLEDSGIGRVYASDQSVTVDVRR